jgi:hypothetical protein
MRFGGKPIPENIMELIPKAQRILDENPNSPLPLKAKIIQNKKVLVDKDPNLRYSFESLTLREYFDFSIKEKAILYRRFGIGR